MGIFEVLMTSDNRAPILVSVIILVLLLSFLFDILEVVHFGRTTTHILLLVMISLALACFFIQVTGAVSEFLLPVWLNLLAVFAVFSQAFLEHLLLASSYLFCQLLILLL